MSKPGEVIWLPAVPGLGSSGLGASVGLPGLGLGASVSVPGLGLGASSTASMLQPYTTVGTSPVIGVPSCPVPGEWTITANALLGTLALMSAFILVAFILAVWAFVDRCSCPKSHCKKKKKKCTTPTKSASSAGSSSSCSDSEPSSPKPPPKVSSGSDSESTC